MSKNIKTKYKPEFCQRLIAHMSEGFSYASFAGLIGVNRDTLYEWEKKHEDWAEAKKLGFSACALFWEKIGINLATGASKGNVISWIFNMKNRFPEDWKEKVEEDKEAEQVREVKITYGAKIEQPGSRPSAPTDTIKKDK